jgi:hypothetical protein
MWVVQDLIRAGGDLTIADRGGMLPADYAEGMKEREREKEKGGMLPADYAEGMNELEREGERRRKEKKFIH